MKDEEEKFALPSVGECERVLLHTYPAHGPSQYTTLYNKRTVGFGGIPEAVRKSCRRDGVSRSVGKKNMR